MIGLFFPYTEVRNLNFKALTKTKSSSFISKCMALLIYHLDHLYKHDELFFSLRLKTMSPFLQHAENSLVWHLKDCPDLDRHILL